MHPISKSTLRLARLRANLFILKFSTPWDQPRNDQTAIARYRQRALVVLLLTVFITVLVGSALLALRNVKLGRGDRKGAFRLAAFVSAVFFVRWLFASHHVSTEAEAFNFLSGVQKILFWTFFFWVVYLAFEPFVRRRWPHLIVSWSRVLAGGFRDPLVGRDILIGAVFGLGILICNFYLANLVPQLLGYPPPIPWLDFPATQLLGLRSFAFGFTQQIFGVADSIVHRPVFSVVVVHRPATGTSGRYGTDVDHGRRAEPDT